MLPKLLRKFSDKKFFKNFNDKKFLLTENPELEKLIKNLNVASGIFSAGLLYRLVSYHSSMGWINFSLSTGSLMIVFYLLRTWSGLQKNVVTKLYLLEDGKHIQINSLKYTDKNKIIKISDILNPEENIMNKLEINYYKNWVMATKKNEKYFIFHDSQVYDHDILKLILQGQDINIGNIEKSDTDYIDI